MAELRGAYPIGGHSPLSITLSGPIESRLQFEKSLLRALRMGRPGRMDVVWDVRLGPHLRGGRSARSRIEALGFCYWEVCEIHGEG